MGPEDERALSPPPRRRVCVIGSPRVSTSLTTTTIHYSLLTTYYSHLLLTTLTHSFIIALSLSCSHVPTYGSHSHSPSFSCIQRVCVPEPNSVKWFPCASTVAVHRGGTSSFSFSSSFPLGSLIRPWSSGNLLCIKNNYFLRIHFIKQFGKFSNILQRNMALEL